ncbi:MAG: SDR family oxidoreductase [Pricia sp.]
MRLQDGKIIWITGASSGIGEALTYLLSQRGCKLILSSRKKDALQKVQKQCAHPENVQVIPLDVSDFESLPEKAIAAKAAFGSIDVLINNAGISQRSLIIDTDLEVYQRIMDVDFFGAVALSKAVLPHFMSRQTGHFVTISSLMGKFASPKRSGYCAAKHALHGFFDALRMEHTKDNIGVTMVCPGFVQTNVAKNSLLGDGSTRNEQSDSIANGIPVAVAAKKIIRAVECEKLEVYMGQKEVFGVYLKRFFPKLLHKIVSKREVT